jgi:hypothetical protein
MIHSSWYLLHYHCVEGNVALGNTLSSRYFSSRKIKRATLVSFRLSNAIVLDTAEINANRCAVAYRIQKNRFVGVLTQLPAKVISVQIIYSRQLVIISIVAARSAIEMRCASGAGGRCLAVNCHPRKSRNTWSFTVHFPLTSTIST